MEEMKGKVSEKGVQFNSELFLLKLLMDSVQVKIVMNIYQLTNIVKIKMRKIQQ